MLSKKTKYGLKALTFLAKVKDREPIQIAEIAKVFCSLFEEMDFWGPKKEKGEGIT